MTKEEIAKIINDIADDYAKTESELHRLKFRLHELISQAIAQHEKSKWKKYPDNLPEIGHTYLIQRKGNNIQITSSAYTYWSRLDIIAFRELPEPYQEGLQSFGSLNGCHNCKHQDNDDVCKKCDDTWDKWEGGER